MANKEERNWLEWTVTIISSILVLMVLSFLVYQLIFQEQAPPDIQVVLGASREFDNYYALPVEAKNLGTETAQKVRIEISAGSSPEDEKAYIEFDFLPGNSTVKGWVGFSEDPNSKKLSSRIMGFVVP